MSNEPQERRRPVAVWRGRTVQPPANAAGETPKPSPPTGGIWRGAQTALPEPAAIDGPDVHTVREPRKMVWRGNVVESASTPSVAADITPPATPSPVETVTPVQKDVFLTADTSLDDLFRALLGGPESDSDGRDPQTAVEVQMRALRNEFGPA